VTLLVVRNLTAVGGDRPTRRHDRGAVRADLTPVLADPAVIEPHADHRIGAAAVGRLDQLVDGVLSPVRKVFGGSRADAALQVLDAVLEGVEGAGGRAVHLTDHLAHLVPREIVCRYY
jgi:hypothetical protein